MKRREIDEHINNLVLLEGYFRDNAEPDNAFERDADSLIYVLEYITELKQALKAIAFGASETTQEAWEIRYQDRFKDWIDYDDIAKAREAMGYDV